MHSINGIFGKTNIFYKSNLLNGLNEENDFIYLLCVMSNVFNLY